MAIKDDMEDVQEAVINELITENGLTSLTIGDGDVTPAKLDRAYLESTGGTVTGNVGIGTNNPVDFGTNFKHLNLNGVKGGALNFTRGTNSATRQWDIYTTDSDDLIFYRGGSSDTIRIQADGTIILYNLPTSGVGLPSGALYKASGYLRIK
jgi:hypothetical protein